MASVDEEEKEGGVEGENEGLETDGGSVSAAEETAHTDGVNPAASVFTVVGGSRVLQVGFRKWNEDASFVFLMGDGSSDNMELDVC